MNKVKNQNLSKKFVTLGQQMGTLLAEPQIKMMLKEPLFTDLTRVTKIIGRFQYSLVIDLIKNCEYDFNFDGWLQSIPLPNDGKVAVHFTFQNNSGLPVTGYFIGYINGVQLAPNSASFENLVSGASFSGVMSAYGTPIGSGTVQLILIEGASPYVVKANSIKRGQTIAKVPIEVTNIPNEVVSPKVPDRLKNVPPIVLASLEMPYFAGNAMAMAASIRSILGITVNKDSNGKIISAEGFNDGRTRLMRLTPNDSFPDDKYDQVGVKFFVTNQLKCKIEAYTGEVWYSGPRHYDLTIRYFSTDGDLNDNGASRRNFLEVNFIQQDATTIEVSGSYIGDNVGLKQKLAGKFSWKIGGDIVYEGDDISFSTYMPNAFKQASYFNSVFPDDLNTIALMNQDTNGSQSNTNIQGVGVLRQSLSSNDTVTLKTYQDTSTILMCLGASLVLIHWWAWAACIGSIIANKKLDDSIEKLNEAKKNKKGSGPPDLGRGSNPTPTPTPFPSNAECLVDSDCPDGYICLNGVCVPLGPVNSGPIDSGD